MGEIGPFRVMELLARARALEEAGRSIVHMEIGEPDFPTPEPVLAAAQAALAAGHTRYTPALGLPALREAIARFYRERDGAVVAPERIIITPGASGALLLALGVLLDPGQRVVMADPGYPCNRHFVRFLEGEAVGMPVDAQSGYQLTASQVESRWDDRTVAAMVASPANPTGTVITSEELTAIDRIVRRLGGRLIVDEIYHGLVYGAAASSVLASTDAAFVVNSFSKYFSMTGWRLGWLVAPDAYVPEVEKLAQNLFIAASTPAQYAALAAFLPETLAELEVRREIFRRRRDLLLPALRALGFRVDAAPQGAFYLYADCSRFTDDSRQFALRLLEEAGVAVTPGDDFGRHQPERYLRFAYTTSEAQLEEGIRRIAAFIGR